MGTGLGEEVGEQLPDGESAPGGNDLEAVLRDKGCLAVPIEHLQIETNGCVKDAHRGAQEEELGEDGRRSDGELGRQKMREKSAEGGTHS